MCDEAFDDCLAALKLIPDWFVTNKMLETLHAALPTNDDILFFNEDFNRATFTFKIGVKIVIMYQNWVKKLKIFKYTKFSNWSI